MSNHISVEINESFAQFTILSNGEVLNTISGDINGRTDLERKESLNELYKSIPESYLTDVELTLAWVDRNSTLVPNFVLNDSDSKAVYKLCFGETNTDFDVDYNRISELSVVNIYQIPSWIKSFFVIKFPRVIIQHAGTHIVRQSIDKDAFYLKINIVGFNDFFQMAIVKHNQLLFYSQFDYKTSEDVIYHLSFVLQQKELLNEKGSLHLINGIDSENFKSDSILEMAEKIKDLSQLKIIKAKEFMAKSQLLCV